MIHHINSPAGRTDASCVVLRVLTGSLLAVVAGCVLGWTNPVSATAPVFHLDFTKLEDVSGNDLPLSVGDAVTLAPGGGPILGNGVQLNAGQWQDENSASNQILILDNPLLDGVSTGAGSIVTWINPDNGDAWNNILKTVCPDVEPCEAFGPERGIEFQASGGAASGVFGSTQGWSGNVLAFGPLGPNAPSSDTPTAEWTHLALTWNEQGERTVYVNGVPGTQNVAFANGAAFGLNQPGDWTIGGDPSGAGRRLEGRLADFAIFDGELSQEHLQKVMRDGAACVAVVEGDLDCDGLLDLREVSGFDPNASGDVNFDELGLEDLDGVNSLTNVMSLSFFLNKIANLDAGEFAGLTNLRRLGLSESQITSIDAGAFAGLTNLQTLGLNNNEITSLEPGTFAGLANLRFLALGGNRITNVEPGAFEGLDSLQELALIGGSIVVEQGDFAGLTNLKTLDLEAGLGSLEAGAFEDLTNLEWLGLGQNGISRLQPGTFSGLSNLEGLSLRENRITHLEAGVFDGLPRLSSLNFWSTPITRIEAGAFDGLSRLQSLDLSESQLTHVEAGVFQDLTNLRYLNLGDEFSFGVSSLEAGAFSGMTKLRTLLFNGNELEHLNFSGADLESLSRDCGYESGWFGLCLSSSKPSRITLDDADLSSNSFKAIMQYASNRLLEASLVGLSFVDSNPEDMSLLLSPTNLSDLTIDTNLYSLYQDEFDAFAALEGKTLTIVDPDCNGDGVLDILDANCTPGRRIKYFLEDYGTVPGDADGVGGVEFADFLVLNSNYGLSPAEYTDGDFDLDGEVGFSDFLVLSGNFGRGGDFTAGATAAVPEPSSLLGLLLATLTLLLASFRKAALN